MTIICLPPTQTPVFLPVPKVCYAKGKKGQLKYILLKVNTLETIMKEIKYTKAPTTVYLSLVKNPVK